MADQSQTTVILTQEEEEAIKLYQGQKSKFGRNEEPQIENGGKDQAGIYGHPPPTPKKSTRPTLLKRQLAMINTILGESENMPPSKKKERKSLKLDIPAPAPFPAQEPKEPTAPSPFPFQETKQSENGQNQCAKKPKEFKSFNHDALEAFKGWITILHGTDVHLNTAPLYAPQYTEILSGQVDAIASAQFRSPWPVMVKNVYQSPKSEPMSVKDIVGKRENYYLEIDQFGIVVLKENTKVWFACQNMMMVHKFTFMQLIVYNPRSKDIVIVDVHQDKEAFKKAFDELKSFLEF